jgi:lipopolysaccharide cholinephosphotransferase
MEKETLDKLHNVILEIIDEFVRICKENNLTYFIIAGTLLGAVRHKGFIPWDDDVDIAMPRDDYEKFLDIVSNNTSLNYYVLCDRCPVNTFYHYKDYAKFCKKNTLFAEAGKEEHEEYSGIWVDIWPYDKSIPFFAPLQTYLISLTRRFYRFKTHEDIAGQKRKYKKYIINILCYLISSKNSKKLLNNSFALFNKINTKHITFFSGIYNWKRETHKYKSIFPLSIVNFEGRKLYAPGDWNNYLKHFYGNYMELPPVEERKTHEPKYIIFDTSEVNEKNN